MLNDLSKFLIYFSHSSIMLNVVRPKKSNLISPAFSTYFIENWVALVLVFGSLYSGTTLDKLSCPITTPAAWVEACLWVPSIFKLTSITLEILSSVFILSWRLFSDLIASLKVNGFDGLNGISLANESISPYGTSKTLPISLTAALEAKVPNVIIWATHSLPYFWFTYSITSSLLVWQKSMSKSGIDILSGFKNRSNNKS